MTRPYFVHSYYGDFWGKGIYRSTDGGDTWQPMWQVFNEFHRQQFAAFTPWCIISVISNQSLKT
jgi:hypothetical protein